MSFKQPAYPQELTNKWWQGKKGTIAKISTGSDGTGIGKQLDELKKQFDKIKWDPIDVFKSMPGHGGSRTPDQLKQGVATAKQAAAAIQPVSKLADTVADEATKLAAEWGKSRVIPKSSTAAATTVAKKAAELRFMLSLKGLSDYVEMGLADEREAAKRNQGIVRKALADVPAKLDTLAVDAAKGVSLADWPKFWSQNVRFIGTQAPNIVKLYPNTADEVRDLRVHSNKQRTPTGQEQLDEWLRELSTGARALRAKMN